MVPDTGLFTPKKKKKGEKFECVSFFFFKFKYQLNIFIEIVSGLNWVRFLLAKYFEGFLEGERNNAKLSKTFIYI